MSVQRIVEDTPPIEMQAETQYDDTEAPVSGCESDMYSITYVCVVCPTVAQVFTKV